MTLRLGSRTSLFGAIFAIPIGYLAYLLAFHLQSDALFLICEWVIAPLALLATPLLLWNYWRQNTASAVSRGFAAPAIAQLLAKLRRRSAFIAAGSFFATLFILFYAAIFAYGGIMQLPWSPVARAQISGNLSLASSLFWGSAPFYAIGLTALIQAIAAADLFVIVFFAIVAPLAAIACILTATALGSGKATPRIALLRPFGERQMTAALKRVVARRLGPAGFVYTLSDKNYRPNFLFHVVMSVWGLSEYILGPILRPSIRFAAVTSQESLARLQTKVSRSLAPSWRTALSGNQALNIASTDDFWQQVVDVLFDAVDFVVMDVSRVSTGSAWEIERIGALGLGDRCLFIAQEGYEDHSRSAVAGLASPGRPIAVFIFSSRGRFRDETAVDGELTRLLARVSAAK